MLSITSIFAVSLCVLLLMLVPSHHPDIGSSKLRSPLHHSTRPFLSLCAQPQRRESVGMRRGFAPHFRQLDDLFAPQNLTMSTILFRSCWVPFRSPTFSARRRSFCPPNWPNLSFFFQILLGPVLNFELRTPTDFDPECPPWSWT